MAASSPLCAEEGEKVRILLLNPNSTQMVTQRIQRAAAPYQSAELEITAATAKKAPPAIETAMDELQASIAVLEELEARKGTYDGAALCCFSDPGLDAAKELCGVPVVGMCEAAVYFSAFYSRRFSILGSCGSGDVPYMYGHMKRYGAETRLASVDYTGTGVLGVPDQVTDDISEKIEGIIHRDGVGAVLLGCAAFAGMGDALSKKHGIYVTDGIGPAIMTLKMLHEYRRTI